MDWIQIGVFGSDATILEKTNSDQASVKVITFLCCIDVLWEGIQQLHRVLFDTDDIPFKDSRDIFHKAMDDNHYWKEIRAAFAAHPCNLKGADRGERQFASWSGGGFGSSGDFSVILYSNDPNKSSEFFDIRFDEIIAFAKSRYEYLNDLMNRMDEIIKQWCEKWRRIPIEQSGSALDDIHVLMKANAERLDNDYYKYRLEEIEKVFFVEVHGKRNRKVLDEYRETLKAEVEVIHQVLQEMNLDYEPEDTDFEDLNYNYQNQQIFEPGKGMISWAADSLKMPLGQYIDLDLWETIEELQVLVNAGWWFKHEAEKELS